MTRVCCFPLDRQHAEVRRCAGNLQRLQGEMANAYWQREMRGLSSRLRVLGLLEDEISRQARAFTVATQIELERLFAVAAEREHLI
jgi:hypothetical protein